MPSRLLLTAVLLFSALAAGEPFGARLDVGVAIPLSQPQSTYFGAGFEGQLSGILQVLPIFDVEAQLAYTLLPAAAGSPVSGPGSVLGIGAAARLKRPMRGALVVPWGDVGVQLALSGGPKLGLVPTVGVLFRFSEQMPVWLGLHAKLTQVFQFGGLPAFDSFHASLLGLGVSVEFFPTDAHTTKDSDGDGEPDASDRCPDTPGIEHGCPAETDQDHDGVADKVDRCPLDVEDKDGFEDEDGCPDPDNDRDGVPDVQDACPREKGVESNGGCPDRDGDGVADAVDACPERAGAKEDGGCPTYREVVVTAKKIELRQKINFAFGKTTILPKSDSLLEEVVEALRDRQSLCVRIEGHTDSRGNEADNQKLSAGRAQAVLERLVKYGLAADRLESKGYGSQLPLDENRTAEGREVNRRVEFVIVQCAR